MSAVINVVPEIYQRKSITTVGFTALARDRGQLRVEFRMEGLPQPSDRAATEATMIASIALAMQQRSVLRVHGNVARSLRHTIDLYQEACAWWWPQRYQKIPIEVGVADDQPPATTRGILCFSGGVDSIFSARQLGGAGQIEAGLLVEGYDIDLDNAQSLRRQRSRVERLLRGLGLSALVMRTNARDVLGQEIIEGAQGSYLAAALTLVSDSFGRGFVSSGILDLANIGEGDPVHEAALPLLGSARFPLHVYGGQISRFEKLRQLAGEPKLFRDIRVCLERASDEHCGQCPKCLLNAFACVAISGAWPAWLPKQMIDLDGIAAMAPTDHRSRYAREILRIAMASGERGEWMRALSAWLGRHSGAERSMTKRGPWRRLLSKLVRSERNAAD
jgi:hypothetical protein